MQFRLTPIKSGQRHDLPRRHRVTIRQYLDHADQAARTLRAHEAAVDDTDEKTALAFSFAVFRAAGSARDLPLHAREPRPDVPWGELISERECVLAEGQRVDAERLAQVVRQLVLPAASELRAELAALEAAGESSSDDPGGGTQGSRRGKRAVSAGLARAAPGRVGPTAPGSFTPAGRATLMPNSRRVTRSRRTSS